VTETPPEPYRSVSEGREESRPTHSPTGESATAEATSGVERRSSSAPEAGTEGGEPTADERTRLRREAARYRVERNQAREQLDRQQNVIAGLQRGQIETMVAQHLFDPADIWRADGVELDALLDEDGAVDPAKVDEAVSNAVKAKPHWAKPSPDFGAGVRGQSTTGPPSFGEALKRQIGQQPR
jgi:hypothetical protein